MRGELNITLNTTERLQLRESSADVYGLNNHDG
jgi:hypothetical protein